MGLGVGLAIAVAVIGAVPAAAASPAVERLSCAVSGRVVQGAGRGVAGVPVRLNHDRGGAQLSTVSGPQGSFRFATVGSGRYDVEVGAPPGVSGERTVSCWGTAEETLEILLEPIVVADRIVVTANRKADALEGVPRSITVIGAADLEKGLLRSSALIDVLGELTPGLASGNHSPNSFGQTLRGRNPLVLLDGVPQSTTRDVSVDLDTVHVSALERVEIARGPSAVYGDGGTGGIISLQTRTSLRGHRHETRLGVLASLSHPEDSVGGSLWQSVSRVGTRFSWLGTGALESVGGTFDAAGDRIPPDPHGQGGLDDTSKWSLSSHLSFDLSARSSVTFRIQHLDVEQNTDYTVDRSVNQLPPRETKARVVGGLDLETPQGREHTQLSVGYSRNEVLGGTAELSAFSREYSVRWFPFDGRGFRSFGNEVFQPGLASRKQGARGQLTAPTAKKRGLIGVWGVDYVREDTKQQVVIMDPGLFDDSGGLAFRAIDTRVWVPEIAQETLGIFGQFDLLRTGSWLLQGGVRHERVRVSLDDHLTLAGNTLAGGDLEFDETVFNVSASYAAGPATTLIASFTQGFSLPDIGLMVRDAPVDARLSDLDTGPQLVNGVEAGIRYQSQKTRTAVSLFANRSASGSSSGGFDNRVVRAPERVYGIEGIADVRLKPSLRGGGSVTWLEGQSDPGETGTFEYLNGFRIPPLKVTGFLEHQASWRGIRNRLDVFYSGGRDRFPGSTAFGRREVSDFLLVTWSASLDAGPGVLAISIQNLMNHEYFPVKSQLLRTSRNDSYAAGPGARVSATYKFSF